LACRSLIEFWSSVRKKPPKNNEHNERIGEATDKSKKRTFNVGVVVEHVGGDDRGDHRLTAKTRYRQKQP
jgi:hypothetical protein